ncbi:ATP dependent DNA ligase-like protein [Rhizobium sp. BK251]|nr:ATP dependent DNA ligase-like protein [Rhizobium sp. BK251]
MAEIKVAQQFGLPADIEPMEAKSAEDLPVDKGWQYEPKWDGFRCLAVKDGPIVGIYAKSGKPLGRYFPEVLSLLRSLPFDKFLVDGELVIEVDGSLSFDSNADAAPSSQEPN